MSIAKKELLYTGKAKSMFTTEDPQLLIADFRDDITAFNAEKQASLSNKGVVNNQLNAFFMRALEEAGVPTHFVDVLSPHEAIVRRLQMIPLESVVRNVAAGSLCKRLGIQPNTELNPPLLELFLKNDDLGDPLVNDNHAMTFGWATEAQLKRMRELTLKINEVMVRLFAGAGMILVDAKYEFGMCGNEVVVGDEISPDSCRIWDAETREILDKDRFRQDLGDVVPAYQQVAERLGIAINA